MRNRHKYPPEWYDKIRPEILKRDEYKCRDCRIKHRSWVAVKKGNNRMIIERDEIKDYTDSGYKCYQVFLQVAHLDNNKSNNNYQNLKSLCVTCHSRMDKEWKKIIRLSNGDWNQRDIGELISDVKSGITSHLGSSSLPRSLRSLGRSGSASHSHS